MLGITILDVLKNDLGRSIRRISKKDKGDQSSSKLDELRDERDQAILELEKLDGSIQFGN